MNKTTLLAITAFLAATAVVIGTLASPAFASFSRSFTTIQKNDQDQSLSGFVVSDSQFASNCITVLSGSNACRLP